jgi:serine/threonine-protein kinase
MNSEFDLDGVTELVDPLLVRARARVGSVLHGKWRLDVLLGMGGMAAVYAATHRNGSRGAVKLLHPELSTNATIRQRFLREGYAANAVGHDGVVRVIDDDTAEDGSIFMVAELLDGETLEERRLRFGGRLGEDEVLSITDQLLDVLVAAHAKGVIHRDLKPENIFLTRDGRVKVLDFGIARLRELSSQSNATKTGSTLGTPAFMAYEQARGLWDEVDARTDLWAVGATMFTLLSGRCVHEGRSTQEVLLGAMTKPAPALASVAENVSPAVAHVVDRALQQDKDARWPDAHRMQERVRAAYNDRFSVPIATAPRLTVPEDVPNRTLPSDAAPHVHVRTPTTGQPVVGGQSSAGGVRVARRVPVFLLVLAAIGSVGVAVVGVTLFVSATRHFGRRDTAASSATPPTSLAPPSTSGTAGATELAPLIPTSAPSASTSGVTAQPNVKPTATPTGARTPLPAPSAAPTASTKPSCNQPFVIDPKTGKKTWKVECL